MIVYAGKQFWNDFNNWDEGVFQDANRPRDYDKFKLRPWLQSDKWDFRDANKNIYTDAAQLVAKWARKAGAFSQLPRDYSIPYLKETYTASDLSFLSWYTTAWWTTWGSAELEYYAKFLGQVKRGNPWCKITNWNVEIVESGTYIIQAFAQFLFPSGYSSSTSYQYREEVALLGLDNGTWVRQHRNQGRACWTWDQILTWMAWWFEKGEIYNVWAAHTYSSDVAMFEVLNIQRLK